MSFITAMPRLFVLGIGVGVGTEAPARAADEVPPMPSAGTSIPPEIGPQAQDWRTTMSAGMAYFAATGPGGQLDTQDNFGLAIESRSSVGVGGNWRAGVGFGMGLTEFHRTRDLWDQAGSTARWTTQAYRDVYGWAKPRGDDDSVAPLRWMGSAFAFGFLTFGYVLAGGMYVAGPIYSTTFVDVDVTASHHFGPEGRGPHLAGGLALIGFSHPLSPQLRGGVGPVFSAGMDLGKVTIGSKVIFSPPSWHGESGIEDSALTAASLTVGITR